MSLEAKIDEVLSILKRMEMAARPAATSAGGVASDADLDGKYGNPQIKKDPKRWKGDSFAGCNYSDCPPEYLDEVASFKEWQAQQDEKKGTDDDLRKAKFARLDAARARGWAQRKRSGWVAPETGNGSFEPFDDQF